MKTIINTSLNPAKNPDARVLEWALNLGYQGTEEASRAAAALGHAKQLKLLHEHDQLDIDPSMQAARTHNHLPIVQWLYSNNGHRGHGRSDGNATEKWLWFQRHPGREVVGRARTTVFKDLPLNENC